MGLLHYLKDLQGTCKDIEWANIWHDTMRNIPWLKDMPSISPGRWAVGYNYLYIMTRILNDTNPKSVLEFGLGASTTLIAQYFNCVEANNAGGYCHLVIEHNEDWITYYTQSHSLSSLTTISKQNLIEKTYKGSQYNAYEDIAKDVKGRKFSVISVDAPYGSKKYSRRDIIEFLPDILEESFVIVVDDANRRGEKNTIKDISEILQKHNIPCNTSVYMGGTDCCVITSQDNAFLCSL